MRGAAALAVSAAALLPLAARGQGRIEELPPLEQLAAPVALYPDPVLALLLPSATHPEEIQAAALHSGRPVLDASVRGLEHYPILLAWLAANPRWTNQLGGAFAAAPADVMKAIQTLRRQAADAGTLAASANAEVIQDPQGQIEILPAQPEAVRLPNYDPGQAFWPGAPLAWGRPYPTGPWLAFDFDWGRRVLWQGDWDGYVRRQGGWNHPLEAARLRAAAAWSGLHPWRPPPRPPPPPQGRGLVRRYGRTPVIELPGPRPSETAP